MRRTDPISRGKRYRLLLLVRFKSDPGFGPESAITWGLDWFERWIEQVKQAVHVFDRLIPARTKLATIGSGYQTLAKHALGGGDNGRIAADDSFLPNPLEALLHAAKVTHSVVDNGQHIPNRVDDKGVFLRTANLGNCEPRELRTSGTANCGNHARGTL